MVNLILTLSIVKYTIFRYHTPIKCDKIRYFLSICGITILNGVITNTPRSLTLKKEKIMSGLAKYIITGTLSAAGGALAYRKSKIGGSYYKFWKKEFWAGSGEMKTSSEKSGAKSN